MKKFLAAVVAIVVIFFLWYKLAQRPVSGGDETRIRVMIPAGTSKTAIGEMLEEQGLIRSAVAFRLYTRLHTSSLQAGTYYLTPSLSMGEVVQSLRQGAAEEINLTIPEGFTVKDIDALVAEKGLADPGAIVACAQSCDFSEFAFLPDSAELAKRGGKIEGYLYPDTYFVVVDNFDPQAFLSRLLSTFEDRVVEGLKADIEASDRTLHEAVTMASLVEEETRTADERPVVAGILWKRLDNGIGLGVDAAVRYILDKPTASITQADLDVNSPYNLRKFRGLPPGPIASSGLESIKATLHPEESEYLFYLHGNDGQIRYARTNDEHNENRRKYLQ